MLCARTYVCIWIRFLFFVIQNLPFSSSMLRVIAVGDTRARVDVVCAAQQIMSKKIQQNTEEQKVCDRVDKSMVRIV